MQTALSIRELASRELRRRVIHLDKRSKNRDARKVAIDAGNSQQRVRQERIDMYTTSGPGRSTLFRSTRIR
jgi:hypothetical protein